MVSRLMLNLRQEAIRRSPVRISTSIPSGILSPPGSANYGSRVSATTSTLWTLSSGGKSADIDSRTFEQTIIGNLGAPIEGWFEGDDDPKENLKINAGGDVIGSNAGGLEGGFEMASMATNHKGGAVLDIGPRPKIAVEVTQEVIVRGDVGTDSKDDEAALEQHWTKGEDFLTLE